MKAGFDDAGECCIDDSRPVKMFPLVLATAGNAPAKKSALKASGSNGGKMQLVEGPESVARVMRCSAAHGMG